MWLRWYKSQIVNSDTNLNLILFSGNLLTDDPDGIQSVGPGEYCNGGSVDDNITGQKIYKSNLIKRDRLMFGNATQND